MLLHVSNGLEFPNRAYAFQSVAPLASIPQAVTEDDSLHRTGISLHVAAMTHWIAPLSELRSAQECAEQLVRETIPL